MWNGTGSCLPPLHQWRLSRWSTRNPFAPLTHALSLSLSLSTLQAMLADALLEVDFLRDTRRIRALVAKLEARRTETATAAASAALARQA